MDEGGSVDEASLSLSLALSLSLSLSLTSSSEQQFVRLAVQVIVFWVPTPSRIRSCIDVLEECAASMPSMIELCSGRQMIKEEEVNFTYLCLRKSHSLSW